MFYVLSNKISKVPFPAEWQGKEMKPGVSCLGLREL